MKWFLTRTVVPEISKVGSRDVALTKYGPSGVWAGRSDKAMPEEYVIVLFFFL